MRYGFGIDILGTHIRFGFFDETGKRICHNARFDLCAFFKLLCSAAEKFKIEFIADDRLIASARKSHIHSEVGISVVFPEALSVLADTYTERYLDSVFALYLAY